MIEALEHHFKHQLDLPRPAADWLLDLWQVIQVFDDAHDGDDDAVSSCGSGDALGDPRQSGRFLGPVDREVR